MAVLAGFTNQNQIKSMISVFSCFFSSENISFVGMVFDMSMKMISTSLYPYHQLVMSYLPSFS